MFSDVVPSRAVSSSRQVRSKLTRNGFDLSLFLTLPLLAWFFEPMVRRPRRLEAPSLMERMSLILTTTRWRMIRMRNIRRGDREETSRWESLEVYVYFLFPFALLISLPSQQDSSSSSEEKLTFYLFPFPSLLDDLHHPFFPPPSLPPSFFHSARSSRN